MDVWIILGLKGMATASMAIRELPFPILFNQIMYLFDEDNYDENNYYCKLGKGCSEDGHVTDNLDDNDQ